MHLIHQIAERTREESLTGESKIWLMDAMVPESSKVVTLVFCQLQMMIITRLAAQESGVRSLKALQSLYTLHVVAQ